MDPRQALDARGAGIMALLCIIWGLQQVVLKAAAGDVTPLMMIALRTDIAALLVWLLMRWRGEAVSLLAGPWRAGLAVGALFALEFFLVGEGLRYTSASHMVVLLYTAPIFVALGLHWRLPAERLAPLQWVGIALAFGGVVVTFLGREPLPPGELQRILLGDLLALAAGIAWGATTVVVRLSPLAAAPAALTLLYQLAGGGILLLAAALALGQGAFRPTPTAFAGLAFQALVVSFASYLTWFWLLKRYLANRLGVFSFLTPLFGLLFGVVLLHEPLETGFIWGTLLVLAGVILVSGHGWLKQWRQR